MKNVFLILSFVLTASAPLAQSKVSKLMEFHETLKVCLVLIESSKLDKFGLPLQFEIDSNFYSKENRSLYSKNLSAIIRTKLKDLGWDDLSDDEKTYLKQKWQSSNIEAGAYWGVKATTGDKISSWDEPYRKCVSDNNLAN